MGWVLMFAGLATISEGANLQPGVLITSGSPHQKRLALTFDDGPGPFTPRFLDLLDRYQVKATFFLNGELVHYRPETVRDILKRGHEIGDHTYNHTNYNARYKKILSESSGEEEATIKVKQELLEDMKKSRAIIEQETGQKIFLCRMPHGIDRPWIKSVAKEMGYTLINWTYGADWTKESEDNLQKSYKKAIKPGAILLFHDGGKNRQKSLDLAEFILKNALEEGFEIVPVGQLIELPPR